MDAAPVPVHVRMFANAMAYVEKFPDGSCYLPIPVIGVHAAPLAQLNVDSMRVDNNHVFTPYNEVDLRWEYERRPFLVQDVAIEHCFVYDNRGLHFVSHMKMKVKTNDVTGRQEFDLMRWELTLANGTVKEVASNDATVYLWYPPTAPMLNAQPNAMMSVTIPDHVMDRLSRQSLRDLKSMLTGSFAYETLKGDATKYQHLRAEIKTLYQQGKLHVDIDSSFLLPGSSYLVRGAMLFSNADTLKAFFNDGGASILLDGYAARFNSEGCFKDNEFVILANTHDMPFIYQRFVQVMDQFIQVVLSRERTRCQRPLNGAAPACTQSRGGYKPPRGGPKPAASSPASVAPKPQTPANTRRKPVNKV